MTTNIGTEQQWDAIFERHAGLREALNALIDLTEKDSAPVKIESVAHEVIFALSRVCVEECWEILLLAANQYGNGALKLLRGLYERALTLTYISKFPEKAERFYKYGAIQEHRTISHARRLYPSDEKLNEALAPLNVENIEANYQSAKADFQRTKCKTCKTTELAHSWDIDVASMAAKVGELFPDLLLTAYVVPTLELHTTLASAFSRATSTPDKVTFDYKPSPSSIDFCIIQALALIYIVRKVVIRTFSLPLEAEMDRFESAFLKAWAKEAS
jgi:hypothetical protein